MEKKEILLGGWRLNAARILSALREVVLSNGGEILEEWPFETTLYLVRDEERPKRPALELKCKSDLRFRTNGQAIYVRLGVNPYFDSIYVKERAAGNSLSAPGASRTLDWTWFGERNQNRFLPDEIVKETANRLFDQLVKSKTTQLLPSKQRKLVRAQAG